MKKYCLRTLIMLFDDCCRCQEHINNQIMAAVGLTRTDNDTNTKNFVMDVLEKKPTNVITEY